MRCLGLACLCLAGEWFSGSGRCDDFTDFLEGFQVHGYQTWTWRSNSVSGGQTSTSAFSLDNYGYDSSFDNNTSLTVDGELIDRVRLHATLNKSRFMPSDRRYYLKYAAPNLDVTFGDLNASLTGNEFANFTRTMRGLQLDTTVGRKVGVSMLASQTDAAVNRDVLPGNNTVGPYYLTRSPIVDGTEEVYVDEQLKQRGVDYLIDYDFGVLTFQGVNVVPNTSTIAVSYEYEAPGQTAGTLVGLRGTAPLTKDFTLGSTLLMQLGKGGGTSQTGKVSHREEFFGANSAGPYSLVYRPLVEGSEVITVAAVPMVRSVDYEINYASGLISFARTISAASLIVVDYQYETTVNSSSADHNIFGLDGAWTLSNSTRVNFEMAYSTGGKGAGDTDPKSGLGFNLRGSGKFGKLDAALGFRKVTDGFRRLESSGFQRNESGVDMTLNYKASDYVDVVSQFRDYTSDGSLNFGVSGAFNQGVNVVSQGAKNKNSQLSSTLTLTYPKLPELRLSYQQMSNDSGTSNNASSMASVDANYRRGKLGLQGQLSLSDQSFLSGGAATSSATTALGNSQNKTRAGRFSAAYIASEKLRGKLDFNATAVFSGGKTTSISDTSNMELSWTPNAKLMVSLSHYLSNSEGGLSGGFGSFGGGFYSGYGGFGSYGSSYGSSSFYNSSAGGWGTVSPTSYGSFGGSSSYGGYTGFGGSSSYSGFGSSGSSFGGWGGASSTWGNTSSGYTNQTGVTYGGGVDNSFGSGSASLFDGLGASASTGLFDSPAPPPATLPSATRRVLTTDGQGQVLQDQVTPSRAFSAPPLALPPPGRQRQFGSTTTTGGKSTSQYTTLTAQYAFNDRLSVNTNFNHQTTDGSGYVSNSTSDDLSLGFSYRASDEFFFLGQWSGQTLTFLDVGGDTTSNIIWLGVQWNGRGGLSANLDYQSMATSSPSTFDDTDVAGVSTGALSTDTSTITLGLRYPVRNRLSAFGEYQIVTSGGNDVFASDRNSFRLGVEYSLNRILSLTAELQKIDSINHADADSNYSATIMSSQLSLRF